MIETDRGTEAIVAAIFSDSKVAGELDLTKLATQVVVVLGIRPGDFHYETSRAIVRGVLNGIEEAR